MNIVVPDAISEAPDAVSEAPDAVSEANAQQALASDPSASVFVSASAGSGKTKLLIDRLLRLMLPRRPPGSNAGAPLVAGSDPARIQCLTFTKAAAAEMQVRLQNTLGEWVTLPDASLDVRLRALQAEPGPAMRQAARALFARVLDLPGGMRISTIHAFCQSLLRRFPIEAAISPHFQLAEETDQRLALGSAAEFVLGGRPHADPLLALLAGQVSAADFTRLVGTLRSRLEVRQPRTDTPDVASLLARGPEVLHQALLRAAGVTHADEIACIAGSVRGPGEAHLAAMIRLAHQKATPGARARASALLDWLAQDAPARALAWPDWRVLLLTRTGEVRANGGFTNAKWLSEYPEIVAALIEEAERVRGVEDACRALRMAALSAALLGLAVPILERHARRKQEGGLLDYDDLIARTLMLLDDPGVAWVLFKLDGGIDHLLLDEVQDTSPLQWQIAWALTGEFFAGLGATPGGDAERPLARTIFAVGDYKQSIYAFQGADPAEFHHWRARFRARVLDGGGIWREPSLTVSFRSVEPVLRLVDAVFAQPDAARGLREPGQGALLAHRAARDGEPGRVELWPLTPVEEESAQPGPWQAPSRNAGQDSAPQRLAEALARWIAGEIGARGPGGCTPLRAGEVLVLVPRRSAFVRSLIRALKSEGVPVATLVRTGLVDQIAVQDLLALCDALLLPGDDLTVACVLTAPLGGLTDDSMMQLATTRGDGRGEGSLWDSLRERHAEQADWARAWEFLAALFARVDYASPHALLAEALGALGGRARLLARLGPEASEPVDELLSAALRYEESHPPSLQGFLHWLRSSEESIKREPDSAGDAVRVMTVHGAKGLQARLVVIPDTTGLAPVDANLLWTTDPASGARLPFWVPRRELASEATRPLAARIDAEAIEERNRLLYVALTRASDRLVVCGWQTRGKLPEDCWYELCRRGFEAASAETTPFALGWEGARLFIEGGAAGTGALASSVAPIAFVSIPVPALPEWLGRAPSWRATAPPAEPRLPNPLAPSRPDDVAFGPRPASRSPLQQQGGGRAGGFARGRLVHALLQHLPALPEGEKASAARAFARLAAHGLETEAADRLAGQALAVLEDPLLADLFGPRGRAEQPLAGLVDGVVVTGQVDRLLVARDRVVLCDFKTGRAAPSAPARVPMLYLRQMSAYRALLRSLYPGRAIVCLLVWTEGPSVMTLPDGLLDMHHPGVRSAAGAGEPA